jgi:TolB-like protein/tetratricopeptide (TPR) repeat protein
MSNFLAELRRRNVFRVAAAYLVVSWLLIQISALLESSLGLPDWFDAVVIGFLALCFPVAVLLAWAFEMTPDGMQKTAPLAGEAAPRPLAGPDYLIIGLLVIVIGTVGYQLMTRRPAAPDQAATPAASSATHANDAGDTAEMTTEASIAVLPFADFSPAGDQQYFSDGIAEELLNALAQFPGLRVAARTSAFSFRGDDVDLRAVGEALGVAHVLEGSVRRSGDRLRITAQLIRVSDGFHLWSQTYDRTLTDVFAVQDEIVRELSRVLQVRLGVGGGEGRVGAAGVNPQAYEQYLRGLSLWGDREDDTNRRNAYLAFKRATEYDPDFADAWAALGMAISRSGPVALAGRTPAESSREALDALEHALQLNPEAARTHAALAAYYSSLRLDIERATFHARRAMEIAPNAAFTNYALADVLASRGEIDEAGRALDRAISMDPINPTIRRVGAELLGMYGRGENMLTGPEHCEGQTSYPICLAAQFRAALHAENSAAIAVILDEMAGIEPTPEERLGLVSPEFETVADFHTAMAAFFLGGDDELAARFTRMALDSQAIWVRRAQLLAEAGYIDQALDVLIAGYHKGWDADIVWHLTEGVFEFPEALRRHPRYHEYWSLPGMAEFAAVRRANGQSAGLPLPIEDDE